MFKVFSATALAVALTALLAGAAYAKPAANTAPKSKTPIVSKVSNGGVKAHAGTTLKTKTPLTKAKLTANSNGKGHKHHRRHHRHHHKQGSNASATGQSHMSTSGKVHSGMAGGKTLHKNK